MSPLAPIIVGLAVPRLEPAMRELSASLRLEWSDIQRAGVAEWPLRVAYARTREPLLQVVEGQRGGPFDASQGPRIDHVDVRSDDVEADRTRLIAQGMPIEFDGREFGRTLTFHRGTHSRTRIELHPRDWRPPAFPDAPVAARTARSACWSTTSGVLAGFTRAGAERVGISRRRFVPNG